MFAFLDVASEMDSAMLGKGLFQPRSTESSLVIFTAVSKGSLIFRIDRVDKSPLQRNQERRESLGIAYLISTNFPSLKNRTVTMHNLTHSVTGVNKSDYVKLRNV